VEAVSEEGVEDEELSDHVDEVEQFDEQVERDEVIAATSTTREAHGA